MRRLNLQLVKFLLPERLESLIGFIHLRKITVFLTHVFSAFAVSLSQEKNQPYRFPRFQHDILLQGGTMIVSKLFWTRAGSPLHRLRVVFCAVTADKLVSQAVIAVRLEAWRKILEPKLLIKQVLLNNSILIGGACTVHAHLKILVVDHNVMEWKLCIAEDA